MRQKKFIAAAAALFISLGSPSAHALSKGSFYLELKTGCYSANKAPTKPSKWSDKNYKTLYSTSCTAPHHYEVFFTGFIKAKDLNSDAAKKEAGTACDNAAINTLTAQKDLPPSLTYGYFFPDPGAEEKKYGKKVLCFFRVADPKNNEFTLSIKRSFREVSYV
jgi:outer membrane protein W